MRMNARLLGRGCLMVFLAIPLACVPGRGGWDSSMLPASTADGLSSDFGRIADLLPELLPDENGLSLFLCRWSKHEPIPVYLPPDALDRERQLWQTALRAWESAGLGISFITAQKRPSYGIELIFRSPGQSRPKGTGDALADCRMASSSPSSQGAKSLGGPPELGFDTPQPQSAFMEGRRNRPGRRIELLGAMLHELGHALGFSGHVVFG